MARDLLAVIGLVLAATAGGCASRTVVPDVDATSVDASSIDATSVDAASIDAPPSNDASLDARAPVDAREAADAIAASDAPSAPDARGSDSGTNRDAAGCLCPQGDACMSDGAILCAPHPDYPCTSSDGWYAVCTETGWDCRFTTPAIC